MKKIKKVLIASLMLFASAVTVNAEKAEIDNFNEYKGQVVETTTFEYGIRVILPETYTIPQVSLFKEKSAVYVDVEESVFEDDSLMYIYSRRGFVEFENHVLKYSETYFDEDSAILTYFYDDWNYIRQDYYKDGTLIESNNRYLNKSLSDNIIKLTDLGWGYAFHSDNDNHSYFCPKSVLENSPSSYYKRLNIEVPYSIRTDVHDDFINQTNDLARAEKELARSIDSSIYDKAIGLLEDVLGTTLGDLARAIAEIKGLCETYEEIADCFENCETIGKTNVALFNCYDILVKYDILD